MSKRTLAVIDGNSLIHRAFHALPPTMTAPDGRPTNAAFGFISMLAKMMADLKPNGVIVAFDLGKPAFRTEALAQYKIHRPPTAQELRDQFPMVKELLGALDIPIVELTGGRATTFSARLARRGEAAGIRMLLVTGDRDAFQLVTDDVKVVTTKKGITDIVIYGPDEVLERYGVTPAQVPDYLGLKGDTSDNIPGVPGVGEKTAAKLLQEWGSLEAVLDNAERFRASSASASETTRRPRSRAGRSRRSRATCRSTSTWPRSSSAASIRRGRDGVRRAAVHVAARPRARATRRVTQAGETAVRLRRARATAVAAPSVSRLRSMGRCDAGAAAPARRLAGRCAARGCVTGTEASRDSSSGSRPVRSGSASPSMTGPAHRSSAISVTSRSRRPTARRSWTRTRSTARWRSCCLRRESPQQMRRRCFRRYARPTRRSRARPRSTPPTLRGSSTLALRRTCSSRIAPPTRSRRFTPTTSACRSSCRPTTRRRERWCSPRRRPISLPSLSGASTPTARSAVMRDIEMPLVPVLARMERVGRGARHERARRRSRRTRKAASRRCATEIHELAGGEFLVDSPKQLSEVLFERMGLPHGKKTKTGYSTDASVLAMLAPVHPIAEKIVEYRELTKLKSTYLDALPRMLGGDGRLHTSFNQTVAATGRLSSSGPNLQNIPVRTEYGRRIRAAFVPAREGDLMLSADYSQIELRILAHLSGDTGLIEAFTSGDGLSPGHCGAGLWGRGRIGRTGDAALARRRSTSGSCTGRARMAWHRRSRSPTPRRRR